jgi:hypothetical protein
MAIAAIVGYFALALYFDRTYVDPRPPGTVVIHLKRPYWHEAGFAYRASDLRHGVDVPLARIAADDPTNKNDTSSPIQLYENKTPIGPGHSTFQAISKTGRGHFAHWSERGIFFSSSDNTNPNENQRSYWAVIP